MEAIQAPTTIDRAKLLPRSGIGVEAPWLVIAPPGNPIIRLDARLLDRVELIGRSPTGPLVWSGVATAGVALAALSFIPGGPFAAAGLAYLGASIYHTNTSANGWVMPGDWRNGWKNAKGFTRHRFR